MPSSLVSHELSSLNRTSIEMTELIAVAIPVHIPQLWHIKRWKWLIWKSCLVACKWQYSKFRCGGFYILFESTIVLFDIFWRKLSLNKLFFMVHTTQIFKRLLQNAQWNQFASLMKNRHLDCREYRNNAHRNRDIAQNVLTFTQFTTLS